MSDGIRCEAMTRAGRCVGHAVKRAGGVPLCETHAERVKHRYAVRLTGDRQVRIAFDMTGNHPQAVIAQVGFGNRTIDETAAA